VHSKEIPSWSPAEPLMSSLTASCWLWGLQVDMRRRRSFVSMLTGSERSPRVLKWMLTPAVHRVVARIGAARVSKRSPADKSFQRDGAGFSSRRLAEGPPRDG